jgi:cysteine desulfurase / selenocysteine lyase
MHVRYNSATHQLPNLSRFGRFFFLVLPVLERFLFMAEYILPDLDSMLQELLLIEEGEHEFIPEDGISELRQLFFPVTRQGIYLNHAYLGPLPRPVAVTMHQYVDDASSFGSINAAVWQEYLLGARRRLALLLNGHPSQVAFTASTSDGLMLLASALSWQEGDTVLLAEGEFPGNVYPWLNLQEQGVKVEFVPARENRISADDVKARITERTRLVSLSLVEFLTGFRNDIQSIASYCHERGVICGVDAMQALGAIDVDVKALDIDFLVGSSQKWLLAPERTGLLYVSTDFFSQLKMQRKSWFSVEEPLDFFNYEQPLKRGAWRFEHSYPNTMPIVGLDAALGLFEDVEGGMQAVEQRILGLTEYAMDGLERLGYPLITPKGEGERSGIVSFHLYPGRADLTAPQAVEALAERSITVSARESCIRISPHFYNTLQDLDQLLNVLEDLKQPPVAKK